MITGPVVSGLEALMAKLISEGLTKVMEAKKEDGLNYSRELINRYEHENGNGYGDMSALQETAHELMLINRKLVERERMESSPLLKTVANARDNVLRYLGRPMQRVTPQDLLEEKMRLAERFSQQLVETKNEVNSTWRQLVASKDAARQSMIAATQAYKATAEQMQRDTGLYEEVAQQLEQIRKIDSEYLPVVRAKDELRRRIEEAHATQLKVYDTVVAKQKEIELLRNHERVMMGLTTRLDCAANAAAQGIALAYRTHAIAQFYKEGKKKMELFDSLQDIALRFIDIEREAREMSEVVERTASRNERTMSAFGRMSSKLGEYSGVFRNIESNRINTVEQQAIDIMNSCGE